MQNPEEEGQGTHLYLIVHQPPSRDWQYYFSYGTTNYHSCTTNYYTAIDKKMTVYCQVIPDNSKAVRCWPGW